MSVVCGLSFAAEINLAPAASPSDWDTLSADYGLIRVLVDLGVTDQQLASMARYLDRIPPAADQLDQERHKALLYAKDQMVQKWNLMVQGQPVPPELNQWLDQVMANVAAREAQLATAQQDAFSGCMALLSDQQRLLIAWTPGGPSDVQRDVLLRQAQVEAQRLRNTVIGLLAPKLERVWLLTKDRDRYFRLRASLARDFIDTVVGRPRLRQGLDPAAVATWEQNVRMGLMTPEEFNARVYEPGSSFGLANPYTFQYELAQNNLYDLFWNMRTMTDVELRVRLPDVAALALQAMGVSTGALTLPPPVITEQGLRDLLLRPESVGLLKSRLAAIQQAAAEMPQ